MNKKKTICFLLFFITIILSLSIVTANQINDSNTITKTDSKIKNTDTNSKQIPIVSKKEAHTKSTKQKAKKDVSTNNTQNTTSKTSTDNNITNYNQIRDAVNYAKTLNQSEYSINLTRNNYKVTSPIYWGNTNGVKTLIINGNSSTLNTNNNLFLRIEEGYNVFIKDLTFNNSKSSSVNVYSMIDDNGKLIINNSNFDLKKSKYYDSIINSDYSDLFLNNVNVYSAKKSTTYSIISSVNSTVVLNNFKVYNNTGDRGAVLSSYNDRVIVNNSKFLDNYATSGGAIYADSSTLLIEKTNMKNSAKYGGSIYIKKGLLNLKKVNIHGSTSKRYGGAVTLISSNSTINDSKFISNKAIEDVGGAIYSEKTSLNLYNSVFKKNKATNGAGIIQLNNYLLRISSSNFTDNIAKYDGGAIYSMFGDINLRRSIFSSNKARDGGAIFVSISYFNITGSVFKGNYATRNGGTIYTTDSSYKIYKNVFCNKKTNANIFFHDNDTSMNLNYNWWGKNSPNFNKITNGYIPGVWLLTTFTTTKKSSKIYTVKVTLNKLSNGKTFKYALPQRRVTFYSSSGKYSKNTMKITKTVTNNYTGNIKKAYIKIDNQKQGLNNKIEPYIFVNNIITYTGKKVYIKIRSNSDINSKVRLKISNKVVKILKLSKGKKIYSFKVPSNWNKKSYKITVKFNGNSKYTSKSAYSKLKIKRNSKLTILAKTTSDKTISIKLPSKYDLRDKGYVTSVKTQGTSGCCWAFATIGALESSILKATKKRHDLSENNMKNVLKLYSPIGDYDDPNSGNVYYPPIGYLIGSFGPVYESADKYDEESMVSPIMNSKYQIRDVYFIPDRNSVTDNDKIKEAVYKYGAVVTTLSVMSSQQSSANLYYTDKVEAGSHTAIIVGWDDDYSKYNFDTIPEGNGAFIIKNSWGTGTGENGFQYVSYYDPIIGGLASNKVFHEEALNNFAFIIGKNNNYKSIYQHDTVCDNFYTLNSKDIWLKNVYTAKNKESIAAVGSYFLNKSSYTVKIYVNGKLKTKESGVVNIPGYRTIRLSKYVQLNQNDKFTAILRIRSRTSSVTNILVENPKIYKITPRKGISFISINGKSWNDLYNTTNNYIASLKVYTKDTPSSKTAIQQKGNYIKITTRISGLNVSGYATYKINGVTLKDNKNKVLKAKISKNKSILKFKIRTLKSNRYKLTTMVHAKTLTIQYRNSYNFKRVKAKIRISNTRLSTKNNIIRGKILDSSNRLVKGNMKVTFKVNSKTIKTITIKNGIIKYKIPYLFTKNKKYVITLLTSKTSLYSKNIYKKTLTCK